MTRVEELITKLLREKKIAEDLLRINTPNGEELANEEKIS